MWSDGIRIVGHIFILRGNDRDTCYICVDVGMILLVRYWIKTSWVNSHWKGELVFIIKRNMSTIRRRWKR